MAKMKLSAALGRRRDLVAEAAHLDKVINAGGRRTGFVRDERSTVRQADDFDPKKARERRNATVAMARRLNIAIQTLNVTTKVAVEGEEMVLAEALELRKEMSGRVQQLEHEAIQAAYVTERHIKDKVVQEPRERGYDEVHGELDAARKRLTAVREACAIATHELEVDFHA